MAYGNIYYAGWNSLGLGGFVYIDKDDYGGGTTALKLDRDSIEVVYSFDDWNSPIIGLTAGFSIRNDKDNFFELMPLMTASEREYKIRIVVTVGVGAPYTIFEGFLNCDAVKQKYLHRQSLKLTASSYLSKLEYITVPEIEELQNITPIEVIDQMLTLIGHNYNIRINSKLYAQGDTLSTGHTLFDVNEFFTELYWEDNVKRKDALFILKSILTSFDCYIYWYDGYWWIERYEDIWQTPSINFVEYQSGGGSSFGAGGKGDVVAVSRTSSDLQLLKFSEMSQGIDMLPGYKTIEVQLNDALYNSIMNPDLLGLHLHEFEQEWPINRHWHYSLGKYSETDDDLIWDTANFGKANGLIINSCKVEVPVAWLGLRFGLDIEDYKWQSNILRTTFKCTVQSEFSLNKTILNIKFKWAPSGPTPYQPNIFTDPYTTGFKMRWALYRPEHPFNFVCQDLDGTWFVKTGGYEEDSFQTISIEKTEFNEDNDYTYDVSIIIPLSEVMMDSSEGSLEGDQLFTFILMLPSFTYWHSVFAWGGEMFTKYNVFGDFSASVNDTMQNNLITGVQNTKFLNKKTIEVDLFDIINLNYKNGLYRDGGILRTILWTDNGTIFFNLVDRLLKNKFKLFNTSRQIISGDCIYVGRLRPCQLFTDSAQSNLPFVLMGFSYFPMSDKYALNLYEYDNTTIVNLI